MTSCTANWPITNPQVGDNIQADFTWDDAVWHWTGEFYCSMAIYDPDDVLRASYVEEVESSGSHSLTVMNVQKQGEWHAEIRVWDGSVFVYCHDYVVVTSGQTGATAIWVETDPQVGDTINADFTWTDARLNPYTTPPMYCSMGIYDPDGFLVDSYDELVEDTGSYTLSVVADVEGTWTCLIAAWTGVNWLYASDMVYVSPGGGGCVGNIIWNESTFYTGPFPPGAQGQLVAIVTMINNGDTYGQITCDLYEYPGDPVKENLIDHYAAGYEPGSTGSTYMRVDIPNQTGSWPLGVKVWCDAEPEPPWGSLQTKIFKTR